jgi:hypothetical protein
MTRNGSISSAKPDDYLHIYHVHDNLHRKIDVEEQRKVVKGESGFLKSRVTVLLITVGIRYIVSPVLSTAYSRRLCIKLRSEADVLKSCVTPRQAS